MTIHIQCLSWYLVYSAIMVANKYSILSILHMLTHLTCDRSMRWVLIYSHFIDTETNQGTERLCKLPKAT